MQVAACQVSSFIWSNMAKSKKWVVTTDGQHGLSGITRKLEDAGFRVSEVLEAIGCLTGTASDAVAEKLRSVPGVLDISPEPPGIDIGPPDAGIS